jgi:hypothetical protein
MLGGRPFQVPTKLLSCITFERPGDAEVPAPPGLLENVPPLTPHGAQRKCPSQSQ